MNEQSTQVVVAPFADPSQANFTAGTGLSRHKPEKCGEFTVGLEAMCLADGGNQCSYCKSADSRNLSNGTAGRLLFHPCCDASFNLPDIFVQQ